jgi:2-hydroxyacyl-CoA lyase 1
MADTSTGASLIARSLKQQGVDYMFGIVGFPVVPISLAAQREGITFIGMRNEQAASYATQAAGYLTGRPQACLVVSGPGVIHALSGLANAQQNNWPMVLLGGASGIDQNGMGGFQEERQVLVTTPFTKYSHLVERADRIPFYVEQAVRTAWYGRPGPTYLDLPDDVILARVGDDDARMAATIAPPPRSQASDADVEAALRALRGAERPLVIVGKGMAWSRAEAEVRAFIDETQLPFLNSPMGKGVMADDHPLSVGAARSHALREADLIMVLGARLNWIMHFGLPPRFNPNVRLIQLDISPEQLSTNVPAEVGLVGDGKAVMAQLNAALDAEPWSYPADTPWRRSIAEKIESNRGSIEQMAADDSRPMNYYRAFRDIKEAIPRDAIIVSEGANTMDIGRTQLNNYAPRTRLDAGSYGTMGVGFGFAVAAAVTQKDRPVVSVSGDSAFGFSGMELETICRYNLPITTIVLNNGGIGGGFDDWPADQPLPPSALSRTARYEKVCEAFGGQGFYVEDPADLRPTLDKALSSGGPSVVHVLIAARADRKPQEFPWKT